MGYPSSEWKQFLYTFMKVKFYISQEPRYERTDPWEGLIVLRMTHIMSTVQ